MSILVWSAASVLAVCAGIALPSTAAFAVAFTIGCAALAIDNMPRLPRH